MSATPSKKAKTSATIRTTSSATSTSPSTSTSTSTSTATTFFGSSRTRHSSTSSKIIMSSSPSSSSSSSTKDFDAVRRYLEDCPTVKRDSRALLAAMRGLEEEEKRLERDAKLRRKFSGWSDGKPPGVVEGDRDGVNNNSNSNNSNNNENNGNNGNNGNNSGSGSVRFLLDDTTYDVVPRTPQNSMAQIGSLSMSNDELMSDWQDVSGGDAAAAAASKNDGTHRDEDTMRMISSQSGEENERGEGNAGEDSHGNPRAPSSCSGVDDASMSSPLGQDLATASIHAIAQAQTQVQSPLAAVALALHAALASDLLGFRCTGIPANDANGGSGGGFAAPVRELPKTVLVPPQWDQNAGGKNRTTAPRFVSFRYRKVDTGAVVLRVEEVHDDDDDDHNHSTDQNDDGGGAANRATIVQVQLRPSASSEPPSTVLQFAMTDHVNLESLHTALANKTTPNKTVSPTLHYKALSILLTRFVQTFDLGDGVHYRVGATAADDSAAEPPHVDATTSRTGGLVGNTYVRDSLLVTKDRHQQQQPAGRIGNTAVKDSIILGRGRDAVSRMPLDDETDDAREPRVRLPSTLGSHPRVGHTVVRDSVRIAKGPRNHHHHHDDDDVVDGATNVPPPQPPSVPAPARLGGTSVQDSVLLARDRLHHHRPQPHPFPGGVDDEPPTIGGSFPGLADRHGVGGDFDGDLGIAPGPVFRPGRGIGIGGGVGGGGIDPLMGGGNLMGPNHPAFVGGGGMGIGGGIGGGGVGNGMRPRFDPYGPPGGPTDPNFQGGGGGSGGGGGGMMHRPPPPPGGVLRPPKRPGGNGNPNHDHQRPPHEEDDHMYL